MSDLTGRPWKPQQPPPPRPPARRWRRQAMVAPLGMQPSWIAAAVILIFLGGIATMVYVFGQFHERQRIVAEERERFSEYLELREAAFHHLPVLTAGQQRLLRRSLNPQHVEAARRIGITSVGNRAQIDGIVAQNGLVRLVETPEYWLNRMSYSVPYVTPDAAAGIDRIAERFAERLADLDIPPFQFNITSVLRTREDQARLRRSNVNASRGASSHEFGTTFDVHYQRFRYAADPTAEVAAALGPLPYDFLYDEFAQALRKHYSRMAERYVSRIGAELGRALIDLENEGVLLALREARQPVYHVTVSRRLAG